MSDLECGDIILFPGISLNPVLIDLGWVWGPHPVVLKAQMLLAPTLGLMPAVLQGPSSGEDQTWASHMLRMCSSPLSCLARPWLIFFLNFFKKKKKLKLFFTVFP